MGPRRSIAGVRTSALIDWNDLPGNFKMRVAQYRVVLTTAPGNPAYQEHELHSTRAHPGWMKLFKHHQNTVDGASDTKVARRTQSSVARPQGVLDLMENSWYVYTPLTLRFTADSSQRMQTIKPSISRLHPFACS